MPIQVGFYNKKQFKLDGLKEREFYDKCTGFKELYAKEKSLQSQVSVMWDSMSSNMHEAMHSENTLKPDQLGSTSYNSL